MKVFILSGIPGSGKSTYAKKLAEDWENLGEPSSMFSADDFRHDEEGNYIFTKEGNAIAHACCLRSYLNHITNARRGVTIVDNTNISEYEIAPYFALGEAYGCEVSVTTILADLGTALKSNVHNVPLKVIHEMDQKLRDRILPRHWNHHVLLRDGDEIFG